MNDDYYSLINLNVLDIELHVLKLQLIKQFTIRG